LRKRFVAYLRVSTGKQQRSGLGLDAQRGAVRRYITENDGTLIDEFVEVESGSRRNPRPEKAPGVIDDRRLAPQSGSEVLGFGQSG
jgi:hypothetical protein